MADPVTTPDPAAAADPLEAIANAHTARMQEISDEGLSATKAGCDSVLQLTKLAGASAMVSLDALGTNVEPAKTPAAVPST